jgi:hypothetical protein
VDQPRRDRRRRGVVRCGAMEASRRGSSVDQPRRHRRARCLWCGLVGWKNTQDYPRLPRPDYSRGNWGNESQDFQKSVTPG